MAERTPDHPFTGNNARRNPPPGRRIAHYVALYKPGDGGPTPHGGARPYLRVVTLDFPDGLIPPPTVQLHQPLHGAHLFHYAQTQADIAKLYRVSQQTIGRWLRHDVPPLKIRPGDSDGN